MSYVAKSINKALTIVIWFLLIAGISFLHLTRSPSKASPHTK